MSLILIKLFLILSPLLFSFSGAAVSYYIARRDLDVVLDIFKNSYAITYWGRSPPGKGSFFSQLALASKLSGVIALSGRYVRRGMLDPEELARLPTSIRTRMKWSSGLSTGGLVALFVVVILFEIL